MLFLEISLINDQRNDFFSCIRANYVRVNFARTNGCNIRVIR